MGFLDDEICGYALFFHNFSTFRGRPGMYMEDIYVEPGARGRGLGRALLIEVLRIARERECVRCEWIVLDWNERAKNFYESIGARPLEDWVLYRIDEESVKRLLQKEHQKDNS